MENAEGIKGFEQWERYVRENEAYLAGQEQRHNTVYVTTSMYCSIRISGYRMRESGSRTAANIL